MAEGHATPGGADFDLTQFYEIFFEEAGENLDEMERILLCLDLASADDEDLNAIFRCAHSIKGGAATFGFSDVAELTHHMESLLDKLRRHELAPVPSMVDVLLQSSDMSRTLLARHQSGAQGEAPSTAALVQGISELAAGTELSQVSPRLAVASSVAALPPVLSQQKHESTVPAPKDTDSARQLKVVIGPLERPEAADAIKELFRDIPGLGDIRDALSEAQGTRCFSVITSSTDADLIDLFAFHVAKEQITIFDVSVARTAEVSAVLEEGYGFFPEAPGAPATVLSAAPHPSAQQSTALHQTASHQPLLSKPTVAVVAATPPAESTTIRVAVSKVDQLINLVGELVITQAMLAQNSHDLDPAKSQQLLAGLADLDRNTRDLQESVMSIRMIPMSIVFSRFPRMLRDLAAKLGKKVELITMGETTELDKGLVEKITDPLTHLVRNSGDHGIEMPAERLAKGKPEHGTITLAASHQGGSIVIEVRDDGRGLSREKILRKARERGMELPDNLPDSDVWQLIFAPGFSTADVVTDVSGRGVGLDVVKRNIASLNGTVEVDSSEGYGMRVAVRLPLTLAIMDGMSVGIGDEVYILPLSSVIESFQVNQKEVSTVAQGAQLIKVRDEYMPVISMEKTFQVPRGPEAASSDIMVVIESDGGRVALLVDELLGQQQVVVKNLESNYRKIPNISGATILGDGKVALILDAGSLVRRANRS